MKTMRGLHASLAVSVVLAAVALAAAAPAAAQPNDRAQVAEELREQGRAALREGRFQDALSAFQQAAFQSRDPAAWLDVGDAADRLRQNDAALDAYRRYLAARPEASNRAEVEARVAVLEAVVAAGRGRPLIGEAARRGLMPVGPDGTRAPTPRIGEAGRRSIIPAADIVDAIRRGRAGRSLGSPR